MILSLPVIINVDYILGLWLKTVPEHTSTFIQLVLVFTMSEAISNPLITAMLATGNIRNYQIVVGGLQLMNLPISYVLLRNGCMPETVLIVAICLSQCCLATRLYMLRGMIGLSIHEYMSKVYFNILIVTALSAIIPCLLSYYLSETFVSFITICVISVICTFTVIYFVGCNRNERQFILSKVAVIKNKFIK